MHITLFRNFLIEGRKEKKILMSLNCFRTIFMKLSLIVWYNANSATDI